MDAAVAAGVKVVVVKQMAPENSPIFAKGSHGGDLHPEIARRPRDHYVEKTPPSAFTGTDLEDWLRANHIDTIAVVGYMTHNCDLSTIIHAVHMGFAVEFLSDASGSVPYANSAGYASAEDIHRVVSVVLQSRFAAVLKTAKTIVWNGPMGVFEKPPFAAGTVALGRAVVEAPAFSVIGGGDTVAAVNQAGVAERIGYISTAGGAFLEFLEGRKLPGVEALTEA